MILGFAWLRCVAWSLCGVVGARPRRGHPARERAARLGARPVPACEPGRKGGTL